MFSANIFMSKSMDLTSPTNGPMYAHPSQTFTILAFHPSHHTRPFYPSHCTQSFHLRCPALFPLIYNRPVAGTAFNPFILPQLFHHLFLFQMLILLLWTMLFMLTLMNIKFLQFLAFIVFLLLLPSINLHHAFHQAYLICLINQSFPLQLPCLYHKSPFQT